MENIEKFTKQLLFILNENKNKIIDTYSMEVGYSKTDIFILWNDLENYLQNCNTLFQNTSSLWKQQRYAYRFWENNSDYVRLPWGKVLICTPSNSVIPLLPILITSFCLVGNNVVIAPSRKVAKTSKFIFNLLKSVFQSYNLGVELYVKGGKEAIDEFVLTKEINLLYFQGSSKNRNEIYKKCINNGVDVIFEGEGNQITIIDEIPSKRNIREIVKIVHDAKSICNGQLCTSPNFVFIKNRLLSNFIDEYKLINQNIDIINFDTVSDIKSLLNNELFSSKLRISGYGEFQFISQILKEHYNFGLQISVFTNNIDFWKTNILNNIQISRLTFNMNPTIQNSLLPWGGYKMSGFSPVVNFFEKATKSVLIELSNE